MKQYHEAIGKQLDALITKRGSCKLKVSEMTSKDPSGHRHGVIDQVHKHGWRSQPEQKLELNPSRDSNSIQEGQFCI